MNQDGQVPETKKPFNHQQKIFFKRSYVLSAKENRCDIENYLEGLDSEIQHSMVGKL